MFLNILYKVILRVPYGVWHCCFIFILFMIGLLESSVGRPALYTIGVKETVRVYRWRVPEMNSAETVGPPNIDACLALNPDDDGVSARPTR